jgi:hypothetical protein
MDTDTATTQTATLPTPAWTKTPGKALILRTCNPDLTSRHRGFQWPTTGPVTCPDWKPTPECGNGLHGLLWGTGDGGLLDWSDNAKWLVVEIDEDSMVAIGQKVKFPAGTVLYSGARDVAVQLVAEHAPDPTAVVGRHAAATGYSGHAAATGDYGHAAATGDYGHAAATGYYGHAAATGDYGHAAATGDYGHAAATGDSGHAAATGRYGIAAPVGDGTATAGPDGAVIARWTDNTDRPRITVGYVGEDGIEAGVAYRCDENGRLVRGEAPKNRALVDDPTAGNGAFKVVNLALERAKRRPEMAEAKQDDGDQS